MSQALIEFAKSAFAAGNFVPVALILLRSHYGPALGPRWRRWGDRLVFAAGAAVIGATLVWCALKIAQPKAWDYPCFYTVARAAASGEAFYRPEVLRRVFEDVNAGGIVSAEWLEEVGYFYLPPSALLLAPLGLFGYRTSLALHYLVQFLFLFGAAALLHRMAPIREGRAGVFAMLVLLLAFQPTQVALGFAQITAGALFFFTLCLLLIDEREHLAGASLGLGFLYKHLLVIVAACAILLRKGRAALAFLATVLGALAVSLLAFGPGAFRDFRTYGAAHVPPHFYLQDVNQSLLVTLDRLFGLTADRIDPSTAALFPPFLIGAAALAAVTAVVCRLRHRPDLTVTRLKLLLLGCFALLVYPGTLYNTIPLVAPVYAVLYFARHRLPVPPWATIAFIATQYAIAARQPSGGFAVMFLGWLALAALLGGMRVAESAAAADGR